MARYNFKAIVNKVYEGFLPKTESLRRVLEANAYDPVLVLGIQAEIDRRKREGELKEKTEPKRIRRGFDPSKWELVDGSHRFKG